MSHRQNLDVQLTNLEKNSRTTINETYSYSSSVDFLTSIGLDHDQICMGSIPEDHLDFVVLKLSEHFGKSKVVGIHVGNFLGISLCHIGNWMVTQDAESKLICMDPNLNHRGITRCNDVAMKLVQHFKLQHQIINIVGYSLWKSVSNDGLNYTGTYDPILNFEEEDSLEFQLENLSGLLHGQIDFIVLDGNHNHKYLLEELNHVNKLLKYNGLVIIDDVHEDWAAIKETFELISHGNQFTKFDFDGRIGILRKIEDTECLQKA